MKSTNTSHLKSGSLNLGPLLGLVLALAAGRPLLAEAPQVIHPDLTFETRTRHPQLFGVAELGATGPYPRIYKVISFGGFRQSASGPVTGIPGPQGCQGVLGSEGITPTENKSVLSGSIVYAYNPATDSSTLTNTAVVQSGVAHYSPWNPAICDTTTPPNPFPVGVGLTDTTAITQTFSLNNPLQLGVKTPTLAGDNGGASYIAYIGDGTHYFPTWSQNEFSMTLSDEDTVQIAENRARVTTVVAETNSSQQTSLYGRREDGGNWTLREVTVRFRSCETCAGSDMMATAKYEWRAIGTTTWTPYRTDTTLYQMGDSELQKSFVMPQEPGWEIRLADFYLTAVDSGCCGGGDGGGSGGGGAGDGGIAGGGPGPVPGSVYWSIPLGTSADGRSAGSLVLHEPAISSQIYTPAPWVVAVSGTLAEVVRDGGGLIRQVNAPQALADFVVTGSQAYEIRFYNRSQVGTAGAGGVYAVTGSPYLVWRIENPDASGASRLRVTRTQGADARITLIDESQANLQSVSENNGDRITETAISTESGDRVQMVTIRSGGGPVVSKKKLYYRTFPWGEQKVKEVLDPDGAALTTLWTYGATAGQASYGRLTATTRPDGSTETRVYSSGALALIQRPLWIDKSEEESINRQNLDLNADGVSDLLTTITRSGNFATLSRDFIIEYGAVGGIVQRDSYRHRGGNAQWDNASNLRTRERFIADGNYAGELVYRLTPDNVLTVRSISETADHRTIRTESKGAPNGDFSAVIDGTASVDTYSPTGQLLSSVVTDIASSRVLQSLQVTQSDSLGRPLRLLHLDGAEEVRTYCDCGELASVALRGETVSYEFDSLRRRVLETRLAGTTVISKTRFVYDAAGRIVETRRVNPVSNAETVLGTTTYDPAGRIVSESSLAQGTTTHAYAFATGNLTIETTTYADGGTRIMTRAASGSPVSIAGTAVPPASYSYRVTDQTFGGNGFFTQIDRPNGSGATATELQTIDLLGEIATIQYATNVFMQRSFDSAGRLARETDPDNVGTLYGYDAQGRLAVTAIDMDRDGVIDYTGTDRITRTLYDVGVREGRTVQRTTTQVWTDLNTDSPATVTVVESAADGLQTWNTSQGLTSSVTTAYDGVGGKTVTATLPDGSTSVRQFFGGRLVSAEARAANATVLSSVSQAYDAEGRLASTTDARTGATTYAYNVNDRLLSVTSPDPDATRSGPGYDAQVTAYTYDALGRTATVTNPDGGVVNTTYYPTGQVLRTWGSRTYPSEYTYDAQNRVRTLTTWQNFAGDSGRAVTTWNYDSRGLLTNKRYQDNTGPSYGYTLAGRLSSLTLARGGGRSTSYDNGGTPLQVTYSDTTPTVILTYDRLGRVLTRTDAAGTCTYGYLGVTPLVNSETYSGTGALAGQSVTRTFDALLRLQQLIAGGATAVTYGYDAGSRLETVTRGTDVATYSYVTNSSLVEQVAFRNGGNLELSSNRTYDALNRIAVAQNTPGATGASVLSRSYDYNAANQRVRATLGDGTYWNYTYDALGQVTTGSKFLSDGTPALGLAQTYTYDSIGNRVSSTTNGQTTNYTPNLLNQYTQRTIPPVLDVLGSARADVPVVIGRGLSTSQPQRQGTTYYDQLPVDNGGAAQFLPLRVLAAQNPTSSPLVALQSRVGLVAKNPEAPGYDADGNLTSDGLKVYTWDAQNRLLSVQTSATAVDAGAPRQKQEYTYDGLGRRISKKVTNYVSAGLVNVVANYYATPAASGTPAFSTYGGNIDASWGGSPGTGVPSDNWSRSVTGQLYVPTTGTWTLSLIFQGGGDDGARLYLDGQLVLDGWASSASSPLSGSITLTAGRAYNVRYEFKDNAGGATSRLRWSGPGVSDQIVPNAGSMLSGPTVAEQRYLYDGWNQVACLDVSGATLNLRSSYVWGLDLSGSGQGAGGVGGLLFADLPGTSGTATHYYAYDGNGNVIGLVAAASGAVSGTYDYDAFGQLAVIDGSAAETNRWRFSTKEEDETGLVCYGYRYYSPSAGRWLSRDLIDEYGGLNLQAFCGNSPVNSFDTDGLSVWSTIKEAGENAWQRTRGTIDNGVFVYDWLFEHGDEKRSYKDGDRLTELLKKSNGINEALTKYKAKNCPPVLEGNYDTIQGFKDTFFNGGIFNPAEWQIGGFIWKITAGSNGIIQVHVDNDASLRSFAGQPWLAQKFNQGADWVESGINPAITRVNQYSPWSIPSVDLPIWLKWPIHTRPQSGQPPRPTDVRLGGNIQQTFDFTMQSPCCSDKK